MRALIRAALLPLLTATVALIAGSSMAGAASSGARVSDRALRTSQELWATIDVCNPKDQPNTVGIRGSMPGDGRPGDKMYMSFRLQIMSTTAKRWVDLTAGASPSFLAVGSSATAREGGRSFQLMPVAGRPASQLRGVVEYQWRHARSVLFKISRPTSAGHQALAGADPAGFSAASCLIG